MAKSKKVAAATTGSNSYTKDGMTFTGFNLHQGDTQWFSIAAIPEGAKKVEKQFVAESERSGSMHALFGNYEMYQVKNGLVVVCQEDCLLNHSLKSHLNGVSMDEVRELPKKDHRATVMPKQIFFAGIQNRFDPLEGHRKRVQD